MQDVDFSKMTVKLIIVHPIGSETNQVEDRSKQDKQEKILNPFQEVDSYDSNSR